jgi:DNA primase
MYRLLANVQQFFEASLAENQNGGRAYVESRMTQDMVIKNGVGYAPSGGKVLVRHLEQKKFSLLLAEKAGVIRKDDKNQYVDVFWGRVMFPVEDITGKIVGFGGRRLTDGPAKYLNSPDTPLFKKSALLYGLYSALEYIETFQEVFVVEGYLDLIQMRASGVLNSVATMGTAFTTEHAKILKKATNRVNLMFDGDPAGQKALQRSVMVAHQAEMKSQVFILPAGTDPDDFFKVPGNRVEDLETMSGLSYLHKTGAEMTDTMKSLLRLERLERGMVYLVQQIPAVAKVLGRRGNLTELFDPASLPLIDEAIAFSLGGTQPI